MDSTQEKLDQQTKKWLRKLEDRLKQRDEEVEQMKNVLAYKEDTKHFLEDDDYVRAWESIVYAWGILETLERLGKFEEK